MGDLGAIPQNLGAGALVVRSGVRVVGVLVGHEPLGMLGVEFERPFHRAVRALFAGSENQLGSEHLEHLATFDRHRGRHEDLDRVALDACDGRQGDAGVARRRLDDRLARTEQAFLFGVLDHRLGNPVFDRAEGVLPFEFADDSHVRVRRQNRHIDHRRVADEIEDALIDDHGRRLSDKADLPCQEY